MPDFPPASRRLQDLIDQTIGATAIPQQTAAEAGSMIARLRWLTDRADLLQEAAVAGSPTANSIVDYLVRTYQKIANNTVWGAVNQAGMMSGSTDTDDFLGLATHFTLTNPGTTPTQVFNVTGRGFLLGLLVKKPATVNSVTANITLTVDGTIIANNLNVVGNGATTGARNNPVVGALGGEGTVSGSNFMLSGPVLVPFNASCKLQLQYSGAPGASENITGSYCLVYA